jgi:hypothetical protein
VVEDEGEYVRRKVGQTDVGLVRRLGHC